MFYLEGTYYIEIIRVKGNRISCWLHRKSERKNHRYCLWLLIIEIIIVIIIIMKERRGNQEAPRMQKPNGKEGNLTGYLLYSKCNLQGGANMEMCYSLI